MLVASEQTEPSQSPELTAFHGSNFVSYLLRHQHHQHPGKHRDLLMLVLQSKDVLQGWPAEAAMACCRQTGRGLSG